MRSLIEKILQTGGAKIYSVLLGIITLSITARWLGPEGRGIYAVVVTWLTIFVELTSLSLGSVLIFKASKERDEHWMSEMIGTLMVHTVIVTIISWLVVAGMYLGGKYLDWPNPLGDIPVFALMIGFLMLPFVLWEVYTQPLLNIEDRLNIFNKFQIAGSTTNTLSVALLVIGAGLGVLGAILSKFLWQLIIAIGGINNLLKNLPGKITYSFTTYKDLIKNGLKMHLNTIGAMMTMHIDIVMVSAYLGNEQTGLYQLAVQMSQMMLIIPFAAMTVLQGELTRKGIYDVWAYQKKILFLTLGVVTVGVLVAALTAQWWLIWLAGPEFEGTIVIFQWLALSVIVTTVTTILSVQWVGRGLFLQISTITLIKGALNIGLNALLIPKYGVMGAVWATLGVVSFSLIVNIVMFIYWEFDTRRHFRTEDSKA